MEDARCCGTGTCIINADGECWCGQRWNGTHMSFPDNSQGKTADDIKKSSGQYQSETQQNDTTPTQSSPEASPRCHTPPG